MILIKNINSYLYNCKIIIKFAKIQIKVIEILKILF